MNVIYTGPGMRDYEARRFDFYGCDGSRSSIQHLRAGQVLHWTLSVFLPCMETIHSVLWIQKMSYMGATSYRSLQKVSNMEMGLVYHTVPKMVTITSCTILAGMFSNDTLILSLI